MSLGKGLGAVALFALAGIGGWALAGTVRRATARVRRAVHVGGVEGPPTEESASAGEDAPADEGPEGEAS